MAYSQYATFSARTFPSDTENSTDIVESASASDSAEAISEPQSRVGDIACVIDNMDHSCRACLSIGEIAGGLADVLGNTEHSVYFGIFGSWGRGKTYLSKKVAEKLEEQKNYKTIEYSAWKYRSTPESWANLYETFAKKLCSESWFAMLRFVIYRYGLWPIIFVLFLISIPFLFDVIVSTTTEHTNLLRLVATIIGYVGGSSALLLTLATLFKNTVRCKDVIFLPNHRDKMGLQATIGDDFIATVCAWIPRIKDFTLTVPFFLTILLYAGLLGTTIGSCRLFLTNTAINIHVAWFVAAAILTFAILPLVVFLMPKKTKRILLIVDDLDRCECDQLEIIESVMLLCKDERMRGRLHVCLLIEDEILESQLLKKYERLKLSCLESFHNKKRLVRENIEKIFDAYLRLGDIYDEKSLEEMFNTMIDAKEPSDSKIHCGNDIRDALSSATSSECTPIPSESTVPEPLSAQTSTQFTDTVSESPFKVIKENETQITQDEKIAIIDTALRLYSPPIDWKWTPRTVNHLKMQYLLARTIIKHVGKNLIDNTIRKDNNSIVNAILDKCSFVRKDGKYKSETTFDNATFQAIIDMVTWDHDIPPK